MAPGPHDPWELQRFVAAQGGGGTFETALEELQRGRKASHWMWFVFPQLSGLGSSPMAQTYGISGLAEARAYLDHPVLGARLRECVDVLLALDGSDPQQVLGSVDAMKLRSSMTLFDLAAAPGDVAFRSVLEKYFGGHPDPMTVGLLG